MGILTISFIEAYLLPTLVAPYLTGVHGVLISAVIGVPTYTPTLVEICINKAMWNMGMVPAAALAVILAALAGLFFQAFIVTL